jgi:hypothetical protein
MTHRVSWHIDNRVILQRPSGHVTIDDLLELDGVVSKMMDESDAEYVHIICDLSEVQSLPRPHEFKLGRGDGWVRHPKRGWFATVGVQDPTIRMTTSVVLQAFNVQSKSFDTIQGAEWFLNDIVVSEWALPA